MGLLNWLRPNKRKRTSTACNWKPTPSPVPQVYTDEDGRRHRADAQYLLPKDDQEIQRLDYQHFILRQVLKGNIFAPMHDLLIK
jgi:hypothetical protein